MKSYFIAFLLLVSYYSSGQIFGCTDPQSTNYNPQATINDGSCNYTVTTAPVTQLALLPNSINETSGLIKWNNHFITHNDNDDSKLYLLDTISGSVVVSYELPVQNTIGRKFHRIRIISTLAISEIIAMATGPT